MSIKPSSYKPNLLGVIIGNLFAVIIYIGFFFWMMLDFESYRFHIREDRIIENLTTIFFLLASFGMLAMIFRRNVDQKNKVGLFFPMCWMFLFFFIFAEEISWGQRIFHFQPPGFLLDINLQKELNVHNVAWINNFIRDYHVLGIAILTTGVLLPALNQIYYFKKQFVKVGFPIVQPHYILFFVAAYLFGKLGQAYLLQFSFKYANAASEIKECLFSIGCMLFAIHAAIIPRSTIDKSITCSD